MKRLITLLILFCISFLNSCDKVTDWTLNQISEAKRYELIVEFDCEKESDLKIVEERLEIFDFRVISKNENAYTLDCPFWITTEFWDILCSNRYMTLIDMNNNTIINSSDIFSCKCDYLELKLRVSETLYNKCDEELFNNDYYLTDGTDKYRVSWLPEQDKNGHILRLFFNGLDPNAIVSADETKALFYYAMNITGLTFDGTVNFTINQ